MIVTMMTRIQMIMEMIGYDRILQQHMMTSYDNNDENDDKKTLELEAKVMTMMTIRVT